MMVNKEKLLGKLRRLKRSLKTDPAVMARYDIDEDGEISGGEWDLAREEIILHLETEKASAQPDETGERVESLSEKVVAAGIKRPDTASEYGPLRVESFWGAIAMFSLCQLYFFILFEGFVFISGASGSQKNMLYVWFGVLFLVSVSAQIEALIKIENYFSGRPFKEYALHITSVEDFIKCLLAVLFGFFFVLFCFGLYPFPSKPHQWWHTFLFYLFIWGLSVAAAKNLRGGIRSTQPLGLMNVLPVIMGFTFFAVSAFFRRCVLFCRYFRDGICADTRPPAAFVQSDKPPEKYKQRLNPKRFGRCDYTPAGLTCLKCCIDSIWRFSEQPQTPEARTLTPA